jgi:hypothetical protein
MVIQFTYALLNLAAMLFMNILTKAKEGQMEDNPFMQIECSESPCMMWLLTNETLIESDFRHRNILP